MFIAPLLLASPFAATTESVASKRPDVVIFVIDDVAAADVESVRTPTIDALAQGGVRFRRGYAHTWCAPTRDSLYRSTWNGTDHGRCCEASPIPESLDPGDLYVGKLLDTAGYETGFFGKWHQGVTAVAPWESSPHLFGWESVRATVPDDTTICSTGPGSYTNWKRVDDGVSRQESVHQTIALRDEFIAWWQEDRGPEPSFAIVNFQACHAPFEIPPDEILPTWYSQPPKLNARVRFEAMLVSVDFVLSQMLSVVGPDTWIILIGDNGTPGCHWRTGSCTRNAAPAGEEYRVKLTTFERGIRVPFIVSGPNLAPRVSDELVHVVDILPTLAEALGIALPRDVDGQSILPALAGERLSRRWVFAHNPGRPDRAIVEARWKLRVVGDVDPIEELYDLENDPLELDPLDPDLPEHAAAATRMRERLERIAGGTRAQEKGLTGSRRLR